MHYRCIYRKSYERIQGASVDLGPVKLTTDVAGKIELRERLGGTLNYYDRDAA